MINNRKELLAIRKMLGSTIRNIRLKKGIKLKKLSKLSSISAETLDQYEMGKNQINFEILMIIANSLGADFGTGLLKLDS